MEMRSFWMYCACEILFSPKLTDEPIKGRILKEEAIEQAEEYGLQVNESMTGAAWAFTYLTKHFGYVKRLKVGVYAITSKGQSYRLAHTKDDFYRTLCSREVVRSRKWHTDNSVRLKTKLNPKPKSELNHISVTLNGHELSGDIVSVGKIIQRVVAG